MGSGVLMLIGGTADNGAFAKLCMICGACSIGVVAERGIILLTSLNSVSGP